MKNQIGVFDSGVGGLTVVKEILNYLPNENILYFGDIARVPYGSKSKEEIISIVREIIDWMLTFDVKAVAMACNTSSALALDIVREEYDIPIFGLIKPTAVHIKSLSNAVSKVGIIATAATVKSLNYTKLIKTYAPNVEVFEVPCPGLVEIIESGQMSSEHAYKEVTRFIKPLMDENVDKIVLGCTHYPYVSDLIIDITGNKDILINPAEHMVRDIAKVFNILGLNNNFNPSPVRDYYVSAAPLQFAEVGNKLMPGFINPSDVNIYSSQAEQILAAS